MLEQVTTSSLPLSAEWKVMREERIGYTVLLLPLKKNLGGNASKFLSCCTWSLSPASGHWAFGSVDGNNTSAHKKELLLFGVSAIFQILWRFGVESQSLKRRCSECFEHEAYTNKHWSPCDNKCVGTTSAYTDSLQLILVCVRDLEHRQLEI